ncbi:MAG: adenylate/guanylate cyclase domain-containing protein, partial [Elusimicrobia bacterium]|nr:adenylate/guanylate cyclase domain-containing protein [Elusimicrobiota bacterium]
AVRACRAALLNQKRLKTLREEFSREGLPPVAVRIGLNTGPSSVGNMGSPRRFNYTAIGDPVNLASRLEGVNKYYGTYILLSGATEALARPAIETRELDRVKVKGKNEPITLYELLGLKGETEPALLAMRDEFASGVAAYRRREWDAAERVFKRFPEDGPSKLLLERIAEHRESPPPDGWDGSHALTEK